MTTNNVIKKTISRGYQFNLAGMPQEELRELKIPQEVVIPLAGALNPQVSEGDQVQAGQVIAQGEKVSLSPVHASVNGRVKAFQDLKCPEGTMLKAIVIEAEQAKDWEPLPGLTPNWQGQSGESLRKLILSSGVATLDDGALENAKPSQVRQVIIRALEDTPYDPSPAVLINGDNRKNFLEGIKILKTIFPRADFHLAMNGEREALIQSLSAQLEEIRLYALAPKYPQGSTTLLGQTILGNDYNKAHATVLSATTVLHIYDAVVLGKPLIERIVALGGLGWRENLYLKVRIGTPLQAIVDEYLQTNGDYRLIPNNMLTETAFQDYQFPVDRNLASLAAVLQNTKAQSRLQRLISALGPEKDLGLDTGIQGKMQPCIFCGRCEDVCPAGLVPHLLEKYVKRDLISNDLIRYGIFDCIDCNLCTFVCPSKLPIARLIKLGQEKLTG